MRYGSDLETSIGRHRWDDVYRDWMYGMRDHMVQYSLASHCFVRCEVGKLGVVL